MNVGVLAQKMFPSPRGDKLQQEFFTAYEAAHAFPSPRGDKLQRKKYWIKLRDGGFRPLAGISCNSASTPWELRTLVSVPSRG